MKLLTSLLISLIFTCSVQADMLKESENVNTSKEYVNETPKSDTLDTIGRAVLKGMEYKSLYNLELEKSQSFEREIKIRDSLWTAERQNNVKLNEQLTEAVRDRGFSPFHTYLMMILGSVATGAVVYLIWGE